MTLAGHEVYRGEQKSTRIRFGGGWDGLIDYCIVTGIKIKWILPKRETSVL